MKKNAAWGHAAYRVYCEISAGLGPVPSPGDFFNQRLTISLTKNC
jgi:hypothetical protein